MNVARVLVKHIPLFKKFSECVDRHIRNEFSMEMAKQSEVVSYCTLHRYGNSSTLYTSCVYRFLLGFI